MRKRLIISLILCVVLDLKGYFIEGPTLYPTVRHVGMCVTGLLPVTVLDRIRLHTKRGAQEHAGVSLRDTGPSIADANDYATYG